MAFFAFVFITCQIIVVSISGGGFAVTRLSATLSDNETATMYVDSTANFLSATPAVPAYVLIKDTDSEIVKYTGKTATTFTGLTRGVTDLQSGEQYDASAHTVSLDPTILSPKVMTTNIGAIDSFVGYNVGSAEGITGSIKIVVASGLAILKNIPRMLAWDYPWFQGSAAILRYPLFALSAGFVWALAMVFLQLAQGILRL